MEKQPFLIDNRAREWQVKRRQWLPRGDNSFLIRNVAMERLVRRKNQEVL